MAISGNFEYLKNWIVDGISYLSEVLQTRGSDTCDGFYLILVSVKKEPCGDDIISQRSFLRECSTQQEASASIWRVSEEKKTTKTKNKKKVDLIFFIRIYHLLAYNQTQLIGYKIKDPDQNYFRHVSRDIAFSDVLYACAGIKSGENKIYLCG